MRKSRKKNSLAKLQEQVSNMGKGAADDRFWKMSVGDDGNGYAVIRFLPEKNENDPQFVRVWDHFFKGPGGYYTEKSLTTLGKDHQDPVSEYNSKLWAAGDEDTARKQKRRLSFYSNIYVVNDPVHPENNGKVFLYRYGQKIFDHINGAIEPKFGEEPYEPFDWDEGATFTIKAMDKDGFRNYDRSGFDNPGPIAHKDGEPLSESEMEEAWKSMYDLNEFIDPENFKTYDELKAKMVKVLGLDEGGHDHDDDKEDAPQEKKERRTFSESKESDEGKTKTANIDVEDESDDMDEFFASLDDDD